MAAIARPRFSLFAVFALAVDALLLLHSPQAAAAYGTKIVQAASWLSLQQNEDGSWGGTDNVRFIQTVEAVQALRASGTRSAVYYRGLTWLQNHSADNADFNARATLTLGNAGNYVGAQLATLQSAQNTAIAGRSGWGANSGYMQSPLDTAIVLNSLAALGSGANVTAAITYLKSAQLTGGGWAVGQETVADPLTTAWVIKSLAPLQTQDSTLATVLTNGVNSLNATVTASSPIHLRALAAHAALLAGKTSTAQTWLTQIANAQSANGNWSTSVYDTALALRALSAADNVDSTANMTIVSIPDANLRAAINAALGRNSMDNVNRGELAGLTSLTANGVGINDLTGLEYAINLTTLDVRNNGITSTAPIDNLSHLTNTQIAGNPISANAESIAASDIPTLPEWGAILFACLLLGLMLKQQTTANPNLAA